MTGTGPLPGVVVTVLGHPEYGQTKTQADGWYSLVVNGGGLFTLAYAKTGYLPVQRNAVTRWLGYAITKPAVLIEPEAGTKVKLSASSTSFQVVRGKTHGKSSTLTPTEDADGARTATVLIPPGTTASIDGLNDVETTLRATEYTTGSLGLQSMPGDLPPSSTYTYAVALGIDEADGKKVTFSQPVVFYVDNFVGFPTGNGTSPTSVPAGYYDTTRGLWVPSESGSGEIVKVLTKADGTVTLDTNGTGEDTPDSAFTPPLLSGERAQIAALYSVGTSFWRVVMPHFTDWDLNWGSGPPAGAIAPDNGPGTPDSPDDNPCEASGSIIECENQILAEQFPLVGTPFALRYQSERTVGREMAPVTIEIPITGATALPSVVTGIETVVEAAGRQWNFHSASLAANQFVTWNWDHKDAFGNVVAGHTPVSVHVGYDYQATSSYQNTGTFGYSGYGTPITGNRALREITIWQYTTIPLDEIDARAMFGLGGLSLTAQNLYDPYGQTFYGGDGSRRTVAGDHFTTITTYAGGGTGQGAGGPATSAHIAPNHLAAGADGTLYVAEGTGVVAVDPKTQILTVVAGNGQTEGGTTGNPGDNKPATSVAVSAYGIAVGPDASVYVTTEDTNRVRRIDPTSHIITTVAGNGDADETCASGTACSDGQAATSVPLGQLGGVAVGPDGCVYFTEQYGDGSTSDRIRKINLDGTLATVLDTLEGPDGLTFGPDGSLYIADTLADEVLRLTPSGALTIVAGGGALSAYPDDLQPATQVFVWYPTDVAVDDDGGLYILDSTDMVVRFVDTTGLIHSVTNSNARDLFLGNQITGTGDGGPAAAASLVEPLGIVLGPGNALFVTDLTATGGGSRVRKIAPPLPGFNLADAIIPSEDGRFVYQFDETGRHQHTFDAMRGQTLATLAYDANGFLSTVTDDAGNVTKVDRSDPAKIVLTAPFGQKTTLALDAAGYVSSIANPNDETAHLTYVSADGAENGLLKTLTDPKGQVHTFTFNTQGLLTEDDNPAGGQQKLGRSGDTAYGWTVTRTTKMGYVSTYAVTNTTAAGWERDVTDPTGATSSYVEAADGSRTTTTNDLTASPRVTTVTQLGPDPRYAMIAPIIAGETTTLEPSGLVRTVSHTRTANIGSDFFDLKSQTDVVTFNAASSQPQTVTTTYTAGSMANKLTMQTTTGRTFTATLDSEDRLTGVAVPGIAPTTFTYNTASCPGGGEGCGGRLVSRTATSVSDGTRTWKQRYEYAPDTGYASSVVDAVGHAVSWTRDPVGRPKQTQLPNLTGTTDAENQIAARYDLNGNLSTLAVASTTTPAPTHAFPLYSAVDDLEKYTPPTLTPPLASSTSSYAYNADRQLTLVEAPEGAGTQSVSRGYDSVGRLRTVSDSLSGVTDTIAYAPGGELQSVTTSDGQTLAYGFGVDGPLLMTQTWAGTVSGSVGFTHDSFLRTASRSVSGGTPVAYNYDADGLYAGSTGLVSLAVSRDFQGKNGLLTGTTVGSVADVLTYNSFGELKTYAATFESGSLYTLNVTTRDDLGRITAATEKLGSTNHTWGFEYDAHGDLSSSTEDGVETKYSFDPNGNRLAAGGAASTYDAQDRLLTSPGATYTYTNNGDLATKVTSSGTTAYTYDLQSALRSVTLPSGDTIHYVIDGQGRRVGRTWTRAGQTVTQGFLYDDQLRIAAELDGAGTVVSTFVYGTRANVADAMVRGGNTYRLISDARGSVRAVVDAAAGTVVESIDYDAWGNATVIDTTCATGAVCAPFQPFGFAGGLTDRETGLVRFGARDYDPLVGRWTQKDRSGFRGGLNLYRYSWNDPINYIDETGRNPTATIPLIGWGTFETGTALEAIPFYGTIFAGAFLGGYALGSLYEPSSGSTIIPGPGYGDGSESSAAPNSCQASRPKNAAGSRPTGLPTGTVPINQSGLSTGQIEDIKHGAGLGAATWTGVAPDGSVWANDGSGEGVEVGHVSDVDDSRE